MSPVEPRDTPTPCPNTQAGREAALDPSSPQDGAPLSWQTRGACIGQPDEWFFPREMEKAVKERRCPQVPWVPLSQRRVQP